MKSRNMSMHQESYRSEFFRLVELFSMIGYDSKYSELITYINNNSITFNHEIRYTKHRDGNVVKGEYMLHTNQLPCSEKLKELCMKVFISPSFSRGVIYLSCLNDLYDFLFYNRCCNLLNPIESLSMNYYDVDNMDVYIHKVGDLSLNYIFKTLNNSLRGWSRMIDGGRYEPIIDDIICDNKHTVLQGDDSYRRNSMIHLYLKKIDSYLTEIERTCISTYFYIICKYDRELYIDTTNGKIEIMINSSTDNLIIELNRLYPNTVTETDNGICIKYDNIEEFERLFIKMYNIIYPINYSV